MRASAPRRRAKRSAGTTAHKPPAPTARGGKDSKVAAAPGKPRDENARRALIAQAAYYRAEKRGFAPGRELDDWLAAESEIGGETLLAHQLAHSDT